MRTPGALPVADASATDGTVTCTIAKTKEGFGLSFQGPKNDKEGAEHGYGVYISDVKEGFPAAQQANVNKGWQIVSDWSDVGAMCHDKVERCRWQHMYQRRESQCRVVGISST